MKMGNCFICHAPSGAHKKKAWRACARQCEWYAARTNDEEDRKFLLRKAKDWTKLAVEKELETRTAAKTAA